MDLTGKYKLNENNGCWEWIGAKNFNGGYGVFTMNKKNVYAHRFLFEQKNGPIPPGMKACHKCDNPGCVNPDHIFIGTQKDNMADVSAKGRMGRRSKVKCGPNHKYDKVAPNGYRYCQECRNVNQRRRRAKIAA